jgi:hypothetical protein
VSAGLSSLRHLPGAGRVLRALGLGGVPATATSAPAGRWANRRPRAFTARGAFEHYEEGLEVELARSEAKEEVRPHPQGST